LGGGRRSHRGEKTFLGGGKSPVKGRKSKNSNPRKRKGERALSEKKRGGCQYLTGDRKEYGKKGEGPSDIGKKKKGEEKEKNSDVPPPKKAT